VKNQLKGRRESCLQKTTNYANQHTTTTKCEVGIEMGCNAIGKPSASSCSYPNSALHAERCLQQASISIFVATRPNPYTYIDNPHQYQAAIYNWIKEISAVILTLDITTEQREDSVKILSIL
jgi:nitrate/nitrite-specific signal transduction histidine kinase